MSLPKVLVNLPEDKLPNDAVIELKNSCLVEFMKSTEYTQEDLHDRIKDKDAFFCILPQKVDKHLLDSGKELKVIGTMSVGYDHIDLNEVKAKGIKLGYTPDVLTDATADTTVGLLLATNKRFFEAHNAIMSDQWKKWSPLWMTGLGLSGSTVGIFGLGRIGQAVLKRLQGFNVQKFIYCSRKPKSIEYSYGAEYVSFEKLLLESDFIIITSEYNKETHHIFNEDAFNKMKNSAILINTARGGVIDQDALIKALEEKKIYAAGLDVMTPEPISSSHPLTLVPNLTLLPHIGSAEISTRTEMAVLTAKNIINGLRNEPMPAQLC